MQPSWSSVSPATSCSFVAFATKTVLVSSSSITAGPRLRRRVDRMARRSRPLPHALRPSSFPSSRAFDPWSPQHDQRVPVLNPLDRRVPPAVRQERADAAVRKDADLRKPPHGYEPTATRALFEARREDVRVAAAAGLLQRPEEARPGELQPESQLVHLFHAQRRLAPQRDVHDGARRLRVQPAHCGVLSVHF
jgi:hypothetical protein